jgi:hypothetical protein
MISVGMSNTSAEFATNGPNSFKPRADTDVGKNPKLVIVNGAQGSKTAADWASPTAPTWDVVDTRLAAASVSKYQVQVAWIKQARSYPSNLGAFPAHAQTLRNNLSSIARNLKIRYPNIKIAYWSSRTRAHRDDLTLNPEPYAYESGFSVKWLIEAQLNNTGNLNYDPNLGTVVAPYLSWGPYLWVDGTIPRSDGLTWPITDVAADLTHPSSSGVRKVADQLLAFFKTDPTAAPWFFRQNGTGIPTLTPSASVTTGAAPLTVNFSAAAAERLPVLVCSM